MGQRLAFAVTTNMEGAVMVGIRDRGLAARQPVAPSRRGEDAALAAVGVAVVAPLGLWSIQFAVLQATTTVGWSAELAAGSVVLMSVLSVLSVLIVYATGSAREGWLW